MKDIALKDFYEWLDTYPSNVIKWEVVDVQEGLRVVNFCVEEDIEYSCIGHKLTKNHEEEE